MLFRNEYYFLSNMYPCEITYNGLTYTCVEATFQAQKNITESDKFTNLDGYAAKKLGRKIKLRHDWDTIKLTIMKDLLSIKFSDKQLAEQLKQITEPIVENNTWNDTYWGVCNNVGENHLGKLLTEIKEELS